MIRIFSGILLVALLLTSCSEGSQPLEINLSEDGMTIFLKSSSVDSLVAYRIDDLDGEAIDKIERILDMLRNGVDNSGTVPTMGSNIVIEKIILNEGHVKMYFSSDYANQSKIEEMICRASIVRSLTNLEGIDRVSFFVDGMPLKTVGGGLVGQMSGSNIVLDFNELITQTKTRTLTLYYPSRRGVGLTKVSETVELGQNETLEMKIVELLMQPPADVDVESYIPPSTVIKSVVTANGVCYIDLGSDFRTDHPGGSYAEKMTVYSIVNSLTELYSVQRVQFMIDGHIVRRFKGSVDFSQLFERNLNYVTNW